MTIPVDDGERHAFDPDLTSQCDRLLDGLMNRLLPAAAGQNPLSLVPVQTGFSTGRSRWQVAELFGIYRETVGKYFDRLGNQPNASSGPGGLLLLPLSEAPGTADPGPVTDADLRM